MTPPGWQGGQGGQDDPREWEDTLEGKPGVLPGELKILALVLRGPRRGEVHHIMQVWRIQKIQVLRDGIHVIKEEGRKEKRNRKNIIGKENMKGKKGKGKWKMD